MKNSNRLLLVCFLTVTTSMLTAQQPASIHMDANNVDMTLNVYGSCESNTLANSGLWLSGLWFSELSTHTAFVSDLDLGSDYSPGPVSSWGNTNDEIRAAFNRVWSVRRWELDLFLSQFDENGNYSPQPGYKIPTDILEWPAHGPTPLNETLGDFSESLAPFVDADGDGRYDPYHGDYPEIKGDQCAFFVFTANSPTHFSYASQLNSEIHGMAYAFDEPSDSIINNTVFFNYKIFFRSACLLIDYLVSYWCDFNIDHNHHDYVGCDVGNDCFYAYSPATDSPSQMVTVLKGIPKDDGDERYGLTSFMYYTPEDLASEAGSPYYWIPGYYYLYQHNTWKDRDKLQYGGTGHKEDALALPLDCNYAFPGNSDPQHLGTNGVEPWGMYAEMGWTEENCENVPGDRYGIGSMGPVSFYVDEVLDFDIALTTFPNPDAVWHLDEPISHLRHCFETGWTASGKPFAYYHDIDEAAINQEVGIYPNPSLGRITIKMTGFQSVEIYDMLGRKLISSQDATIDLAGLSQGVYVAKIFNSQGFSTTRPIVLTAGR